MREDMRDIAQLLRTQLDERDASRVLKAAQALYPSMGLSPTASGYWHIRTRQGFSIPYFGAEDADLAAEPSTDFCALYFTRPERGHRRDGDRDGVLRTLFRGSFSEGEYDAVDRTFRILTDVVLESTWPRLNARRGYVFGRIAGHLIGLLVPPAAAGWLWNSSDTFRNVVSEVLSPVPEGYRTLAFLFVGVVLLGACSSLLGGVGSAVGRLAGRLCERRRLGRLDPLAAEFTYGPVASNGVRREFSIVTEEQNKQREFDRIKRAGIDMSPDDFLTAYAVLPYLRQLGVTERQRRDEVEALSARLGPDFPVSIMRLVEPYVPRPRP